MSRLPKPWRSLGRCALMPAIFAAGLLAWPVEPHRQITRTALDALPEGFRAGIAPYTADLVTIYCMLPDRYVELERFGFRRKGPWPLSLDEMAPYCVRPDGEAIHSATWNREDDLASLVFLFERIVTRLGERRPGDAVRYMGTLSHLLADSLSPPHAVSAEQLLAMAASTARRETQNLHAALEASLPALGPVAVETRLRNLSLVDTAARILERCYSAAGENRKQLPAMIRAIYAGDQHTLNRYRLRAGNTAAVLLAESLTALFWIARR